MAVRPGSRSCTHGPERGRRWHPRPVLMIPRDRMHKPAANCSTARPSGPTSHQSGAQKVWSQSGMWSRSGARVLSGERPTSVVVPRASEDLSGATARGARRRRRCRSRDGTVRRRGADQAAGHTVLDFVGISAAHIGRGRTFARGWGLATMCALRRTRPPGRRTGLRH